MAEIELTRDANRELAVTLRITRTVRRHGDRTVAESLRRDIREICAVDAAAVRDHDRAH